MGALAMPIDPNSVKWDEPKPDGIVWDEPPKEKGFIRRDLEAKRDLLAGVVRGAGSIGATLLWPIDKGMDLYYGDRNKTITSLVTGDQTKPLSRNEERRKGIDEGLTELIGSDPNALAYKAGKLGGEIAGTAGAGGALANGVRYLAPGLANAPAAVNFLRAVETAGAQGGNIVGARTLGGAVNGALSAGMVNPEDALKGAAIGGVAPGTFALAGKAGSLVGNMFRPSVQNMPLAKKAIDQYQIPLGAADISNNGMVKAARSVLNDMPLIGRIGDAQKEAVQGAYNKAVGGTFGATDTKLTPAVMDAAKGKIGAELDRLWGSNSVQVDPQFISELQALQQRAAKLPKNEGGSLTAELDDLFSKMQPDANGALQIPGDVANKFQSYLRRRAESSAGLRGELTDFRKSVIAAFNRSVTGPEAQALATARGQYKAFKTVEPLLNSAEAGVAGRTAGDVPAGLLPGAVLKNYGNASGTAIGDLSQIGSQFIADRVARTGGSNRAAVQNSAIGAALGMGGYSNPLMALATIPTAAGANKLLGSPTFAQALLAAKQRNAFTNPLLYRSLPALAGDQ
jgi:hypothetical protein